MADRRRGRGALGSGRSWLGRRGRPAVVRRSGRGPSVLVAVASAVGLVGVRLAAADPRPRRTPTWPTPADAPWLFVAAAAPCCSPSCSPSSPRAPSTPRRVALLGVLAACGAALRIPSPGVGGLRAGLLPAHPGGPGPRPRLRVRARRRDHRRLGPDHRRGRPVAAVPDVRRGLGGVRRRLPAAGQGAGGARAAGRLRARSPRSLYGTLLNLWFWPFGAGTTTSFSFRPGAGAGAQPAPLLLFDLTTSLGFDIPRAVTNAVLVLLLGRRCWPPCAGPPAGPPSTPRSATEPGGEARARLDSDHPVEVEDDEGRAAQLGWATERRSRPCSCRARLRRLGRSVCLHLVGVVRWMAWRAVSRKEPPWTSRVRPQ